MNGFCRAIGGAGRNRFRALGPSTSRPKNAFQDFKRCAQATVRIWPSRCSLSPLVGAGTSMVWPDGSTRRRPRGRNVGSTEPRIPVIHPPKEVSPLAGGDHIHLPLAHATWSAHSPGSPNARSCRWSTRAAARRSKQQEHMPGRFSLPGKFSPRPVLLSLRAAFFDGRIILPDEIEPVEGLHGEPLPSEPSAEGGGRSGKIVPLEHESSGWLP
jgi:hypothetical protein